MGDYFYWHYFAALADDLLLYRISQNVLNRLEIGLKVGDHHDYLLDKIPRVLYSNLLSEGSGGENIVPLEIM